MDISERDQQDILDAEHAALEKQLSSLHTTELAEILMASKNDTERLKIISAMPDEQVGETLLELPERMQESVLSKLNASEIESVVEHLDSDDAADILQSVSAEIAEQVISGLDPEDRRGIETLMLHDEESAGGLMQAELFKVRDDWKARKVLKVLRRWGQTIENLNYIYAVNQHDRLTGVIQLHTLLFCNLDDEVWRIADADFPRVSVDEDQEEVARMFEKYDKLALPVVDKHGVLVGRITADDIIDVVHEEATEDMFRLAGLSDQDDLSEPVGITAYRRGIWLTFNLITAILASVVISQFEATLQQIVALAVLMPIVASMGGIAGTQTLTVMVRGIALGRITFSNAKRTLLREVSVSLVTGLGFALLIGVIARFWFPAYGNTLGLIIAAAIMLNLIAAGLAGALIPLTLQRLDIDPALASGTILTTVTDVVGFLAFLGLATVFLL
ncbi:MAG: magnesium transporter [Zetaproteobacteria bacterium CG2_30_46_52]|nr:MAG: magnesium transporter [Zetaproteobacteria bacterium CG2_30_46_52]